MEDQVCAFVDDLLPNICTNRLKWCHTCFNVKLGTFNAENRVSIQKFTHTLANCLLLFDITVCHSFFILNDEVRAFIEHLLPHVCMKWGHIWFIVKLDKLNAENRVSIHKFTSYFANNIIIVYYYLILLRAIVSP